MKIELSLVQWNRFTSAQVFLLFCSKYLFCTCSCTLRIKQVPFSMTIGNELMHECFPKHSCMGVERIKYDKVSEEKGKKRDSILYQKFAL